MGLPLGVQEARDTGNRIYLNLRIGKIAQTANDEKEGFKPAQTKNKSGNVTNFFAKAYDSLTGYVKEIAWHKSEFKDGGTSQGWNVTINTGEQDYVLYISDKDRPFHRFMSALGNVDFNEPVKFVGFQGNDGGKVLLMYQDEGDFEQNIKPKPVQPKWEEKWLSNVIKQKVKEKIELNEKEERSIQRLPQGKIAGMMTYDAMEDVLSADGYPYIVQGADSKWDFTVWNKFLMSKMHGEIIPAVELAQSARDEYPEDFPTHTGGEQSWDNSLGNNDFSNPSDDDIPF